MRTNPSNPHLPDRPDGRWQVLDASMPLTEGWQAETSALPSTDRALVFKRMQRVDGIPFCAARLAPV